MATSGAKKEKKGGVCFRHWAPAMNGGPDILGKGLSQFGFDTNSSCLYIPSEVKRWWSVSDLIGYTFRLGDYTFSLGG